MPRSPMTIRPTRAAACAALALAFALPLATLPEAPALAGPPAHAQGGGKGNPGGGNPGRGGPPDHGGPGSDGVDLSDPADTAATLGAAIIVDALFTDRERRIIQDYFQPYRTGTKGLPPGLAKRDTLPPGLAKRGGALPPGLAAKALPGDLRGRLPTRDDRWRRVIVGSDVLLIDAVSDLIVDVIRDVF